MRSAWWRWTAAGLVAGLAVMTVVALPAGSASAAATVAFTPKFQANANGAMITIGNNLLTCPAGSISTTVANVPCADARNGAAVNNNSYTMSNLDADSDPTTDNSSSSTLALPAGSTVLWAGLYWGARLQAGTGGKSASASTIDRMSFKAPGDASYRTIAASTAARDQFGPNSSSYNAYQRFADVTSIVRAAGNGSYWGANVTAATGQDRYAGWAMTVVYTAPGLPLRNLTVFDGFDTVSQGTSQTVTVSGFLSPKSGAVDAQLTMLAYEGDLSQTGDYVKLNNTQLATAISPGSNFFNSANDLNGTSVTTRTPDDRNMLGFDIKNLGVSGAIDNNATSATFTFASTGDMYYPGLVGLAINLYAPDFTASSKTVVDLNGNNPARPGDTLQYTLNYTNTGQDPATGVVSTDVLPANTTYVPGSLVLNPLTAPQRLTDASGDDAGEYLAATRTVQVRLGSGASATAGGTLGCSGAGCATSPPSMAWYSFQVTLDGAAGGTTVTNIANLRYVTATTGTAATYPTAPATTPVVRQADVSIAKTMAPSPVPAGWTAGDPIPVGTTVAATLLVTNNGPSTATDVTVNDPIPADWTGVALASPTSGCAIAAGALTCALGDLTNGQRVTITLTGRTAANSTATSLTNTATVTTTAADPVPANNVSSATVGLGQQADLSVTKTAAVTSGPPGSAVTWTVTAKNNGPSDATNVLISDGLDAADQATLTAATLAAGGTCAASTGRAVRCAVTTLPAGTTATMTVTGVLGSNLAAGTVVGNTALVSANTPDPNPANNTATAGVTTTAPQADVRVTKTGPAAVVPGQSISWTVTATNFGPSDAAGVVVTDTVPDGVSNLTALTTRGTCQPPAGQVIACPVGTLVSGGPGVAGAAAAVTITGIVAADAAGSPAGTLVNTASATATTADPAPGNNSAQASTTLTPQVDLAVAKTATRTTLPNAAGQPVTYTIAVTNNGPSAARNVTVTDLVPLVLGLGPGAVTTTAAGGTCDTSQASQAQPAPNGDYGLITCTLPGPILPGAGNAVTITVPMTSTAPLTPAPGTDVLETASATAAGATDTNPGNNSATWILSGDPYVDLAVTTSAPATVVAGNLASGNPQYTVTVTNTNDPNNPTESVPALRPVITDTLPPGVTLNTAGSGATVTSGPAGQGVTCTVAGQVLTCQLVQDLNAGESVTVTIPVIIDTNALPGSTLTNVVSVATADATSNPSGNPDRNPANDTAQAASVVIAVADPRVSIQSLAPVDAAVSGPGSSWTLSFSVGNNGPSTARQSQVHVEVAVPHTWLGPLPSGCAVVAGELVCQFGDLPQGVANVYQVTFAVMGYAVPGSFVSTVHISSVSPEPDTPMALANNTANITRTLGDATTDLAVSKVPLGTVPNPDETTGAHPSFVAGGAFAYQFQVQVPGADDPTAGAGDAQDVVVTDTMPAGFIPQQVDASQGTCLVTNPGGTTPVAGGTAIRCALGTVDGYTGAPTVQPVTVTVNGTVDPSVGTAEQVPNTVHAATDTPLASRALDVTASADVDVVEQGDLQLSMMPDATTATAGGRAGYTLTVVNAGPSGVAHAVVTVSLPAGFAFDAANSDCTAPATSPVDETAATPRVVGGSGPEFSCLAGALDPSTGQRTGALAAGQSVSFHVVADTDDTLAPGTATATATVGSLTRDVDWSNNTAHADIAIVRLTDLAVSASVSTLTPAAGQAITFTGFAVNNGPSPAVNTTGTTVFPAGFVPVSYDVPYNTCTWSPAAPKDPTAEPWRDIAYTLTCVPQAPPGVDQVWEPGGAATNVVVMYIPRDTPAGSYTGRSTISSDTPEVTLDNNVTTLHLTVDHVADTSVVKTLAGPDPMRAGGPATYRLTVTNHGPSVADNVIVSDTVPSGMTYRSATITGGGACPPPTSDPTDRGDSETTLRCPVGTLAVGRSVTVTVTFGVDENQAGHRICNTAIVGSGALDPDATNNESQACGTAAESIAAASDQRDALAPTGSDVLMLALVVLLVLGTGIVAALASVGRRAPAGVRRR